MEVLLDEAARARQSASEVPGLAPAAARLEALA
jgi:hypothetical protein